MSILSTHILDAVHGKPAAKIPVRLESHQPTGWTTLIETTTNPDGRCPSLHPNAPAGLYRLTFLTAPYFANQNRTSIYPEITLTFEIDGTHPYHLPLLLSDNSYTTYRGS